jgi:hypothetical protein
MVYGIVEQNSQQDRIHANVAQLSDGEYPVRTEVVERQNVCPCSNAGPKHNQS